MIEHLHTLIIAITYNFLSLKTRFYVITNRTCSRYFLYILHGHPSRNHVLILNLEALRDSDSFISLGTKSDIFRSRLSTDSVPCQAEFTLLLLNKMLLLRWTHLVESYFIFSGAILFLALNISVARAYIFL